MPRNRPRCGSVALGPQRFRRWGPSAEKNQLGELGLVLNAVVLWTTRYLEASVEALRALPADEREHDVLDEDIARVSPLRHANLNALGRYTFRRSQLDRGPVAPARTQGFRCRAGA
ncbi:Tn3 family transposase [Streptomyces nigrescens]